MLAALHVMYAALGFLEPYDLDDADYSHFTVRSWIGSIFPAPEVSAETA